VTVFKEMDPKLVLAAIEGHVDVLSSEAEDLEKLYRARSCPRCNLGLQKEFDPRHVFADQSKSVGRALLRCTTCKYLLDPHSGLVIEVGDASKIPTPVPDVPYINPATD
jgi:hypothetical protein